MSAPAPIYTPENCGAAYQLNWSVSIFTRDSLPSTGMWLTELRELTEKDAVRILECRLPSERVALFLASTQPHVPPAEVLKSIKGRLGWLLRKSMPIEFKRNYRIESVGSAKLDVIDAYVARQPEHHPLADPRSQRVVEQFQFFNPEVDLERIRYSNRGQFIHNLQVVLEHADGWRNVTEDYFDATRKMLILACEKKAFLLSRIGVVSDHLHILLGCDVAESPMNVAISLLNNLAFAHGMRPLYRFGFYVGTVGTFDLGAIRSRHRA